MFPLVLDTPKEALRKRNVIDTILHSDQGKVYNIKTISNICQRKRPLSQACLVQETAMITALIESFHSHLKSEGFHAQNIKQSNNDSIIQTVDEYIHYYNNERIRED